LDAVKLPRAASASGTVRLGLANLGAYPASLDAALDDLARRLVPEAKLKGLGFRSGRWLPPPDVGAFVLRYDDGGNEGHKRVLVTVDFLGGRLVDIDTR
jgi:hypothetical protein